MVCSSNQVHGNGLEKRAFIVFWTAAAATLFDAARVQKPRDLQTEMPSSRPLSFQFWYEHILWYEHSFITLIFEGDDLVRRFLRLPSRLSCAAFLEGFPAARRLAGRRHRCLTKLIKAQVSFNDSHSQKCAGIRNMF